MIDNNKIEESAKRYTEENSMSIEDQMGDIYNNMEELSDAYKTGAKWAINEFIKDLLHQKDEEPEGYDEWILLHYNIGNCYLLTQVKEIKSWKGFVEKFPIDRWLYIDDLFPKEGGEQ